MIKVLKKIMKETRAQLQKTYEDSDKKSTIFIELTKRVMKKQSKYPRIIIN